MALRPAFSDGLPLSIAKDSVIMGIRLAFYDSLAGILLQRIRISRGIMPFFGRRACWSICGITGIYLTPRTTSDLAVLAFPTAFASLTGKGERVGDWKGVSHACTFASLAEERNAWLHSSPLPLWERGRG